MSAQTLAEELLAQRQAKDAAYLASLDELDEPVAAPEPQPTVCPSSTPDLKVDPTRPVLRDEVFYGLAGVVTKKLEPCTESHPAGLLVEFLIYFGNVIGRSAYVQIDDTKHFTNEFAVKVGESSRARKGTGKNRIKKIFEDVDSEWLKNCNKSGIGSGEKIIHLLRDPRSEMIVGKKSGVAKMTLVDAGVRDKRLNVNTGEFQGVLAVCHRSDSLMSVVLRDGWDGNPLYNEVKNDPASCQEYLLSVMADTTSTDLSINLSQADRKNGFANRFLWVYVYRTKLLPFGGGDIDWTMETMQLRDAVQFARGVKRVFMDEGARKLWSRTLYPKLERDIPGLVGALTSRGSAHTLRLAMLYALLDQSAHIQREHLEAAYALWQYCEDSAQKIFGELISPEQQQILDFLGVRSAATKTQLYRECFKNNRKADLIQNDLNVLVALKKVVAAPQDGVPWYSKIASPVATPDAAQTTPIYDGAPVPESNAVDESQTTGVEDDDPGF